MSGACAVCQAPAQQYCAGCKATFYCSREHQKQHWKVHKNQCRPFKVVQLERLGRSMIATRDIKEGEIVLKENPLIIGPKPVSVPLCLGCNKQIDASYKCSQCGWPLCGPSCESSVTHKQECAVMQSKEFRPKIGQSGKKEALYSFITPLRCLFLKDSDPEKWEALMNLESHVEERKNTPLYKAYRTNIVEFIRNRLGLEKYDEETIFQICAIWDTNGFEIREKNMKVRGIYPLAAMLAHNCKPNTKHVFDSDLNIVIIAITPIKKGETIFATYTQTLWGTLSRRAHLKAAKCFDCCCERCSDATEFGTYVGAINCSRCGDKVLSTNPLDNAATWKCEGCTHSLTGKQMAWGNDALKDEILQMDKTNPRNLEHFLEKYKETLHPKNSHVLEVKYALSQIYGNMAGYMLSRK